MEKDHSFLLILLGSLELYALLVFIIFVAVLDSKWHRLTLTTTGQRQRNG